MAAPEFPSMTGRVCIVTGANSGIGKAIVRRLASLDATVVMACRSLERGEAARRELDAVTGNPKLAVLRVDLASLRSVRAFAEAFASRYPKLHVLVNNAGIYTSRRVLTEDGVESTFQTNHLGHFLLTNLLLDTIRASAPSRIVNVASQASRMGTVRFDDLNGERRWGGMAAYAQSKLANVLFTVELARRLDGAGVVANAMHPGVVRTAWASKGGGLVAVGVRIGRPFMVSPAKGADTAFWLAASAEAATLSGQYLYKRRPIRGNPLIRDAGVARRLWGVSEELTGLRARGTPAAQLPT